MYAINMYLLHACHSYHWLYVTAFVDWITSSFNINGDNLPLG